MIPRTSPETYNYSELCRDDPRKRVLNTSRASTRSLYRKPDKRPRLSSTILKIKSDQIMSNTNMKPRQVSCNTQISKITIFYEHLKQYLSRIFQHPAPKTTSPERSRKWTQCPQVQNANQLTEQPVKSSFIPAARSGGSPASSPVSAKDMVYSY